MPPLASGMSATGILIQGIVGDKLPYHKRGRCPYRDCGLSCSGQLALETNEEKSELLQEINEWQRIRPQPKRDGEAGIKTEGDAIPSPLRWLELVRIGDLSGRPAET